MRVRFAPSPTGALHIGGVRTALYNYLLAKKNGGQFILRIEDTDQDRYVEGAEDYIIEALDWLGLSFDESPAKGGDFGPYRQSERKETGIYQQFANKLVADGNAYFAFDTKEELDAKRAAFEAEGKTFKYDASTRMDMKNSLTLEEAAWKKLVAAGAPQVVRLMIPDTGTVIFEDMVRGQVRYECSELDDKVMLKSDGMPTYHLANIVDDYHMKITHVIRGEEWLPSTPLHVLMYEYLGWKDAMPTFSHLPLILKPEPSAYINKRSVPTFKERFTNEFVTKYPDFVGDKKKAANFIEQLLRDVKSLSNRLKINENKDSKLKRAIKTFLRDAMNGKLSKRDGDRLGMPVFPMDWNGAGGSFRGFREWGFLPEAVLNMLALLGWNDSTDKEIYSLEEMVSVFSMDRVASAGARFNFEKAKWFNKQYLIAMPNEQLAAIVRPDLEAAAIDIADDTLYKLCGLLKKRITFINEFIAQGAYFFEDIDLDKVAEQQAKNLKKKVLKKWSAERLDQLNELIAVIDSITDFDEVALEDAIEPLIDDQKGVVFPIFRLALSGRMGGPSIYAIMEVLGKEQTLERLQAFMTFCDKKAKELDAS